MPSFEHKDFIGDVSSVEREVFISSAQEALEVFDREIVPFFAGLPGADEKEVAFALSDLVDFLENRRQSGILSKLRVSESAIKSLNETLREAHQLAGLLEIPVVQREAITKRLGKVRQLLNRLL